MILFFFHHSMHLHIVLTHHHDKCGVGGGYAEGIFLKQPLVNTTYDYHIAIGGKGGFGFKGGSTAETSWFSEPAHLASFGGQGGDTGGTLGNGTRSAASMGGFGGDARGSNLVFKAIGGRGGQAQGAVIDFLGGGVVQAGCG